MDYKLEVVVTPVSDVDRAKAFYQGLGWRLDADFALGPGFRVVQVTPPGWPTWYAQYMVDESSRQDVG